MHDTRFLLAGSDFPTIYRKPLQILQLNLGYRCNLSCVHCHVNASPKRSERMSDETLQQVLGFAAVANIRTIDLTGGAPEMHPGFQDLVRTARREGISVIDRCNLVILQEAGYEGLAAFLAEQQVEIVASLPCYLEDNVDQQRGRGVFNASIAALQLLNRLGYGLPDSPLQLHLVFNPLDAVLPPDQAQLEAAYKQHLQNNYGIFFNRLFAMANMPIQRFGSMLFSQGRFDDYLVLLRNSFRAENLDGVMCRHTLSVDWQGYVYDCDFNQMLAMPAGASGPRLTHIRDLNPDVLNGAAIATAAHCYGCAAGQGSGCGGALEVKSS